MPDDGIIRIFVSYSHDDYAHCTSLRKALGGLTRADDVELWCDREIKAGTDWKEKIDQQMECCDIFIALLSMNFTGSEQCLDEFYWVIERLDESDRTMVPVYLQDARLGNNIIARLDALPTQDKRIKPVEDWRNPSKAWNQIAELIEELIDELRMAKQSVAIARTDRQSLADTPEATSTLQGYKSTNRNALPDFAELTLSAGEDSSSEMLDFQPDIRLGEGEVACGKHTIEFTVNEASLGLHAASGSFLPGAGLGERSDPHRTDTLTMVRTSTQAFKISPADTHEYLYGYLGDKQTFCKIRIDDLANFQLRARLTVRRRHFNPVLKPKKGQPPNEAKLDKAREKIIKRIVEKGFAVEDNLVLLSECSLEPEE